MTIPALCRRSLVLLAAMPLVIAGCGDDDSASPDTTVSVTEAATTVPTTPAPTAAAPTTPAAATTTSTATTSTTVAPTTPPVVEITIDADTAAAAPLTETVALGEQVRIVVRSATPQEFHLHGYDVEDTGTEVVFAFTADMPGEFELESHDTGLLLTLTVA